MKGQELSWAMTFLMCAILTGFLGFWELTGSMAGTFRICFFFFLVMFCAVLIGVKPK